MFKTLSATMRKPKSNSMSNKPNTTTTPSATAEKIAKHDRSLELIGGSPEEIAVALHNDAVKPRRASFIPAEYFDSQPELTVKSNQQTGHTPGPWSFCSNE